VAAAGEDTAGGEPDQKQDGEDRGHDGTLCPSPPVGRQGLGLGKPIVKIPVALSTATCHEPSR